jgi:hypothetical protein
VNTTLSHPAVINVRVDTLATNAINQKIVSGQLPHFSASALYINDLTITPDYKK